MYSNTLNIEIPFFILEELIAKYGKGETFEDTCTKCGTTVGQLLSSGVHDMNGCIRIYCEDDSFVCPTCNDDEEPASTDLSSGMCTLIIRQLTRISLPKQVKIEATL